jgi:hypothetical protein
MQTLLLVAKREANIAIQSEAKAKIQQRATIALEEEQGQLCESLNAVHQQVRL